MQKNMDIVRSQPAQRRNRRKLQAWQKIVAAIVAVVIIAGFVGMALQSYTTRINAFIDKDKYQAVFLANSQVYFGKLRKIGDDSYRMTNVFYIQSNTEVPTGQTSKDEEKSKNGTLESQQSPTLIKLGQELHGPEDAVVFNKSQITFWENLRPDGKVAQAITNYKSEK